MAPQRRCSICSVYISNLDINPRVDCAKCRGIECDLNVLIVLYVLIGLIFNVYALRNISIDTVILIRGRVRSLRLKIMWC